MTSRNSGVEGIVYEFRRLAIESQNGISNEQIVAAWHLLLELVSANGRNNNSVEQVLNALTAAGGNQHVTIGDQTYAEYELDRATIGIAGREGPLYDHAAPGVREAINDLVIAMKNALLPR